MSLLNAAAGCVPCQTRSTLQLLQRGTQHCEHNFSGRHRFWQILSSGQHTNWTDGAPKSTWQAQDSNSAVISCRANCVSLSTYFFRKACIPKIPSTTPSDWPKIVLFLLSTGCTQPTSWLRLLLTYGYLRAHTKHSKHEILSASKLSDKLAKRAGQWIRWPRELPIGIATWLLRHTCQACPVLLSLYRRLV